MSDTSLPDPRSQRKQAPTPPETVPTSWLAVVAPPDDPVLGIDALLAASKAKLSVAMVGPDAPPDDVHEFVKHQSDRARYAILVFRREADRFEHAESNPRAVEDGALDDRGTDALLDRMAARAFDIAYIQQKARQHQGKAHVWRFEPMAREIWIASGYGTGTDIVYVTVESGEDVLAMHGLKITDTLRSGRGVVLRFTHSASSRAMANGVDAFVQRVAP